nr:reverse transcriptase domain-containing protein [Tanacetum cinerariifolium]
MDQPIQQVLSRSEVAGRLQKWSIELREYAIHYRPRVSVKGHILADFIVERPEVDSSSALMESRTNTHKPKMGGIHLRFEVQENVDSRLVANQVNETYVAKEVDMIRYLEKVRTLTNSFKAFSIRQVPRSENKKADALSKIASTSIAYLSKTVLIEELKEKSISDVEILAVVKEEGDTWMTLIFKYLEEGTLPADVKKARAIRRKSWRFAIVNGTLHKKSFLGLWLRSGLFGCSDGSGRRVPMNCRFCLWMDPPAQMENVDSRLVANQVNETYVAKEVDMIRYLEKVRTLTNSFKAFSIRQVPRSENKKADALSKIASTSIAHLSKTVLIEELKEKSISDVEILAVVEEEGDTWMTLIFKYLEEGTLPVDVKKARAIRRKSWRFAIVNGTLYKKSFLGPWLRSHLDDGRVCREMVDEFAPSKFLASVQGMKYELLKAKDKEIGNIKAHLVLKEAEAAEAIRLCAEASNFVTMEKSLRDEVNAVNERNTIFEKDRDALDVKVADLEASVLTKEREMTDLNTRLTSVKSHNNSLVDQVLSG